MANRLQGVVKWFSNAKGYGFIQPEQGDDVFVHYADIEMEGYRTLEEGMRVEFELVEENTKGPRAQAVRRI
ncbi:MAG: cold shock domain-containing protein [Ardenticatenales bacterium]|nr:cold shock domain-containing protein [Ardenticatenales bacterium]